MKLIAILFLLTMSSFGFSSENFDYNSIYFDGPNCFAYVAMEKGFIKHYRFVSGKEASYYLENYCKELSGRNELRSGDVYSVYSGNKGLRHSGLFSRVVDGRYKVIEKGTYRKSSKVVEVEMGLKTRIDTRKYFRCGAKIKKNRDINYKALESVESKIASAVSKGDLSKILHDKYNQALDQLETIFSSKSEEGKLGLYKIGSLRAQLKYFHGDLRRDESNTKFDLSNFVRPEEVLPKEVKPSQTSK